MEREQNSSILPVEMVYIKMKTIPIKVERFYGETVQYCDLVVRRHKKFMEFHFATHVGIKLTNSISGSGLAVQLLLVQNEVWFYLINSQRIW